MAALTEDDLAYLRTKLGSSVNDETNPAVVDDLQVRYDRLGSLQLVVVDVLRQRLADIANPLENPLSYTIPGEYGQDASGNVTFLTKALAQAEQEAGVPGSSVMVAVPPGRTTWNRRQHRRRWAW